MRCPGCGIDLNRQALKVGRCLQCQYPLPIVGRTSEGTKKYITIRSKCQTQRYKKPNPSRQ